MSSGKVKQFFKYGQQGTDAADAQVTWYIEKNWVDINVTDRLGCNAAHYAAARNRPDLLLWLARHGIDINHQNTRGRTPMHTAAEKGRSHIITALLEAGAAPALEIFDNDGNLPMHVSAVNLEVHTLRAFLRLGCDPTTPNQKGKTPEQLAGTGARNLHMLGVVKAAITNAASGATAKASVSGSEASSFTQTSIAASRGTSTSAAATNQTLSTTLPPTPSTTRSAASDSTSQSSPPSTDVLKPAITILGGDLTLGPSDIKDQTSSKPPIMLATIKLARTLHAVLNPPPPSPSKNSIQRPEEPAVWPPLPFKARKDKAFDPALAAKNCRETCPYLTPKLQTVEPLVNSLHRALSRDGNNADPSAPAASLDASLSPLVTTLVELWRTVERAGTKAGGGWARLKASMSATPGGAWGGDLLRLDHRLHLHLEGLTADLHSAAVEKELHDMATPTSVLASTPKGLPPSPHSSLSSLSATRHAFASSQADTTTMVALDAPARQVAALLQQPGGGGAVLLHGLPGVGKTATARAVYDLFARGAESLDWARVGGVCCWVGLQPDMGEEDVVAVQNGILEALALGNCAAASAEGGRQLIREQCGGRRALLVLDGVWPNQLQELLPPDMMSVLAPGSLLLLTSRICTAAAGALGRTPTLHTICPLGEDAARELLARRAFGAAELPGGSRTHLSAAGVLGRCGGLPLAIEVVAEAWRGGSRATDLWGDWEEGAGSELFAALHASVDSLSEEEGDSLLDVARHLVGSEWGAAEAYCGADVLRALVGAGLVERDAAGKVAMHGVLQEFCGVVQQEIPGSLRLVVARPEEVDAALEEGVRGARFLQVDLELQAATQKLLDHRILVLEGCMLWGQLQWSFQQLLWLAWTGPRSSQPPRPAPMEPLVQAGLRVLRLQYLPFTSIDLHTMPALRDVAITDMPNLHTLTGLPHLPHLASLTLSHLPILGPLADLPGAPALRSLTVTACPSLPPRAPRGAPIQAANPHLQALNSAAFKNLPALENLSISGGWDGDNLSVAECNALRSAAVSDLGRVTQLALLGCPAVEEVRVSGCSGLRKVLGLAQMHGLRVLRLEGAGSLEGLLDLSQMGALREVVLRGVGGLSTYPRPEKLQGLDVLVVE